MRARGRQRLLLQSLDLCPDTFKNGITHDVRKARGYPLRHRLDSDRRLVYELLDDGLEVFTHTVDFGHLAPVAPLNSGHFVVWPPGDHFPLRVRIQKTSDLKYDTDLLIDQVRAISNARFMFRCCTVSSNTLKKVEEALRLLTAR